VGFLLNVLTGEPERSTGCDNISGSLPWL